MLSDGHWCFEGSYRFHPQGKAFQYPVTLKVRFLQFFGTPVTVSRSTRQNILEELNLLSLTVPKNLQLDDILSRLSPLCQECWYLLQKNLQYRVLFSFPYTNLCTWQKLEVFHKLLPSCMFRWNTCRRVHVYCMTFSLCHVHLLVYHAVAQIVEALRYTPEGRGFDSR